MSRAAATILPALVAFVAALGWSEPVHAAAQLSGIRSSAGSGYTRIVVDLTQASSFEYAILPADPKAKQPARLYIDLKGVRLIPGKDYSHWVGDTRVRRVRTGQFSPSVARVVLELEGPVTPKVFQLKTPARVVIDLSGEGSVARRTAVAAARQPASKPSAASGFCPCSCHQPRAVRDVEIEAVGEDEDSE